MVYLYIGSYGVWKNQEIVLSSDYIVKRTGGDELFEISISVKHQPVLYGTCISDIQLIVGQNGSGKSTIIRFLDQGYRTTDSEWFAVYVSDDGNIGENIIVTVQDKDGYKFYRTKTCNEEGRLRLIREDRKTGKKNSCSCLFYRQLISKVWYTDIRYYKKSENYLRYIDSVSGSGLIKYARTLQKADAKIHSIFANPQEVSVEISFQQKQYEEIEAYEEYKKELEETEGILKPYEDMSAKEMYLYFGFKNLFFQMMEKEKRRYAYYTVIEGFWKAYKNSEKSELLFFHGLCKYYEKQGGKEELCKLYDLLMEIPDELFIEGNCILYNLKDGENKEKIDRLLEWLESDRNEYSIVSTVRNMISVQLSRLSYGEASMMNLFAGIYSGIQEIQKQGKGKEGQSIILLLDEPDDGFHPEWSRRLIYTLYETLNSYPFNEMNCYYQLIITTHSPIMLSDVPSANINCIVFHEHGRSIEKQKHGFLSNINDLMKETFFMDSLFGEYAKTYTNELIQKIVQLRKDMEDYEKESEKNSSESDFRERFDSIRNGVSIIEEPVIRAQIERQLNHIRHQIYHDEKNEKEKQIQKLLKEIYNLEQKDE